jgi:hypothetical protein
MSLHLFTEFVLGTPSTFSLRGRPTGKIRPRSLLTNVARPGFAYATKIALLDKSFPAALNREFLINVGGHLDLYEFSSQRLIHLDLPALSKTSEFVLEGGYTGLIPYDDFEKYRGETFSFCTILK